MSAEDHERQALADRFNDDMKGANLSALLAIAAAIERLAAAVEELESR